MQLLLEILTIIVSFVLSRSTPSLSNIGNNLFNCPLVFLSSWHTFWVCIMEIAINVQNTANKTTKKIINNNTLQLVMQSTAGHVC